MLDSNVIVAMVAGAHEHHTASLTLLAAGDPVRYAVAAHSYAEAYSTLTRRGVHPPFGLRADEAWAALASLRALTSLIGLTPAESFEAIRVYAASGGVGPRLYDALIGRVAVAYGISTIVTWNVRHMRGLFPALDVVTPVTITARRSAKH